MSGIQQLVPMGVIGAYGNFTNLRLTNNTARDYANFTPPTTFYPTY